jgi:hypothetical protein
MANMHKVCERRLVIDAATEAARTAARTNKMFQ